MDSTLAEREATSLWRCIVFSEYCVLGIFFENQSGRNKDHLEIIFNRRCTFYKIKLSHEMFF
jgi:hypothetical protein